MHQKSLGTTAVEHSYIYKRISFLCLWVEKARQISFDVVPRVARCVMQKYRSFCQQSQTQCQI